MMPKKTLILCVDRDADLKVKAGISGPVVGRDNNIKAANKLLLKDPEEVDGNTIFEAIRLYDSMKANGEDVEIATITGDAKRGLAADRMLADQLDKVLSEYPADSCIFVSDGADDEQVIPIISSRVKIDSVRLVSMKQSKELERTYFLILEKLKEPYFARIFIGVPALILLGLVISYSLGFEWRPVAALVGLYLLLKGFGVEDQILGALTNLKFKPDQVSTLAYVISLPLFLLTVWMTLDSYLNSLEDGNLKALGYATKSFIIFLIPPISLIFLGRIYDFVRKGDSLSTLRMVFYVVLMAAILYMIWMFASWVTADAFFGDLIKSVILSIVIGAGAMEIMNYLKRDMIRGVQLLGKEVYSSEGNFLGKVVSVDDDNKSFVYINPWKKKSERKYSEIKGIDNRVILG